jgi:hypothetical protein
MFKLHTKFLYFNNTDSSFNPITLNGISTINSIISDKMHFVGINNRIKKLDLFVHIPVTAITATLDPVYVIYLDNFLYMRTQKYDVLNRYVSLGSPNIAYLIKLKATFFMKNTINDDSSQYNYLCTYETNYATNTAEAGSYDGNITVLGTPTKTEITDMTGADCSVVTNDPESNSYRMGNIVFSLKGDSTYYGTADAGIIIEMQIFESMSY